MFVVGPVFNYAYNWASSHGGLCVNTDYSPEINPIYVEIQSPCLSVQYNTINYNTIPVWVEHQYPSNGPNKDLWFFSFFLHLKLLWTKSLCVKPILVFVVSFFSFLFEKKILQISVKFVWNNWLISQFPSVKDCNGCNAGGRKAGGVPIQLPRVIEWGVGVNDSREFELHIGCHWHIGGEGCT